MELTNVLSVEELEEKFSKIDNWKVTNIAKTISGNVKEKIDNWPDGTRNSLLKMLDISEDENFKGVYYNNAPSEEKEVSQQTATNTASPKCHRVVEK